MARRVRADSAITTEEQQLTTLSRIREKELELDGLVLIARSDAEKFKADTAIRTGTLLEEAEAEATRLLANSEASAIEAAESEAASIIQSSTEEVIRLRELAQSRRQAAADEVVRITVGEP
jgi:vacuolar-type H+-ATPase subunit H